MCFIELLLAPIKLLLDIAGHMEGDAPDWAIDHNRECRENRERERRENLDDE